MPAPTKADPTYTSWRALKQRCLNPNHEHYWRYADKWYAPWDSFQQLLADVGPRPAGTTLDRIDSAKGYSPENCRWASRETQARNRVANKLDENAAYAIRMAIGSNAQVARKYGISRECVRQVRAWEIWA